MTALGFLCLIIVFILTAVISVVTGGAFLITAPVMMQLGIEPHVAIATNVLSLILPSLGGTVTFLEGEVIPAKAASGSDRADARRLIPRGLFAAVFDDRASAAAVAPVTYLSGLIVLGLMRETLVHAVPVGSHVCGD